MALLAHRLYPWVTAWPTATKLQFDTIGEMLQSTS